MGWAHPLVRSSEPLHVQSVSVRLGCPAFFYQALEVGDQPSWFAWDWAFLGRRRSQQTPGESRAERAESVTLPWGVGSVYVSSSGGRSLSVGVQVEQASPPPCGRTICVSRLLPSAGGVGVVFPHSPPRS